jgi:hypothetical protein
MGLYCLRMAVLVLVLAAMTACASSRKGDRVPPGFAQWLGRFPEPPVVAILPFTNRTNQPDLPQLVRAAFYGHFSPLPFKDREIGEIDRALVLNESTLGQSPLSLSPKELASLLGCQALIFGEVTKYNRVYAGLYSQLGVAAKIKIVDAEGDEVIWKDAYFTRFHRGSVPLTEVTAMFSVVTTGLNLRNAQELRAIDDLCRNLVARIPPAVFTGEIAPGRTARCCELQVAAFNDLERAKTLRKTLRDQDCFAFIRTVEEGGTLWHRVLLGPFDCGEQLERWKQRMTAEFHLQAVAVEIQH